MTRRLAVCALLALVAGCTSGSGSPPQAPSPTEPPGSQVVHLLSARTYLGSGAPVRLGPHEQAIALSPSRVQFRGWGSGSCPPHVGDVSLQGRVLLVRYGDSGRHACTNDLRSYDIAVRVDREIFKPGKVTRLRVAGSGTAGHGGRLLPIHF